MDRTKIEHARELAKKALATHVMVMVADKATAATFNEAKASNDPARMLAACEVSVAWMKVREKEIADAEAAEAEAKLIIIEAMEELGLNPADFGLQDEKWWDKALQKEDK